MEEGRGGKEEVEGEKVGVIKGGGIEGMTTPFM